MNVDYEDLFEHQFENLVVHICYELFGLGVQGFAKGRDGGRDARFHGTAERFPSREQGWRGLTIIQAKHTNGYNTHFSDPSFSGDTANSVLSEEIPRIKALRVAGQVDNYLLVANRRLGGNVNEDIIQRISTECKINKECIQLAGVERLDDWLKLFPEAATRAGIRPFDTPLLVDSAHLAEVILSLGKHMESTVRHVDQYPVPRVSYTRKNRLNGLSEAYAKKIEKRFLKYTSEIEKFLAAPGNAGILEEYEDITDDFDRKIVAHRGEYDSFDSVLNYLIDFLVHRDPVLARNSRLTKAMVFYMYWHCDIGETDGGEDVA